MKSKIKITLCVFVLLAVTLACETISGSDTADIDEVREQDLSSPTDASVPLECGENLNELACAVFEPGETIKIGFAGPLEGDYSMFGVDILNAGELALEGKSIAGLKFELVARDTGGSPEEGVAVAEEFVSDPGLVAIFGHVFSGESEAAIPIYNQARIPMMSPSATLPTLTGGDQDVFHRNIFTDEMQGGLSASFLKTVLGVKRLAVMHDGGSYGQGLAEYTLTAFIDMGGDVVSITEIKPGENQYDIVLDDIAENRPDAIYFGGYAAEGIVISRGLTGAGLGDVILFCSDGVGGEVFIDRAGKSAEGVYSVSLFPYQTDKVKEFNSHFEEVYGYAPGEMSAFTWTAFDAVNLLFHAIKYSSILGNDGNLYIHREKLIDLVNNLSNFKGLGTMYSCNEGECNSSGPFIYVVQNGEWVVPEGVVIH